MRRVETMQGLTGTAKCRTACLGGVRGASKRSPYSIIAKSEENMEEKLQKGLSEFIALCDLKKINKHFKEDAILRKLCKIRNFSQSPFGGFISEESDGNFPSGRN